MTDTNQLREAFEVRMTDGGKWPAAVERGRGGAYRLAQTENAWTEWQACAESLQAIAQVQGEAATVAVDHFDNAPNTEFTSRIHPPVEIGTKLYATPQPAQATQAEAQQPATGEPVVDVRCEGCGYMTHHREHMGCVRAAKQHTHPAPSVPAGYVSVPLQVLRDASEALGNFVSDHGWGDADMQAMDNLDAYIARHDAKAQKGQP